MQTMTISVMKLRTESKGTVFAWTHQSCSIYCANNFSMVNGKMFPKCITYTFKLGMDSKLIIDDGISWTSKGNPLRADTGESLSMGSTIYMRDIEAHLLSSMCCSIWKSSGVAITDRKAWILGKCHEAKGKRESVNATVLYLYCIIHTAPEFSGPCQIQLSPVFGYFKPEGILLHWLLLSPRYRCTPYVEK
jgi:hypothetical protein